jgi:hypothetical protein
MVYSQLAGPRFDAGGCNLKGDTPLQTSPLRGLTPPLTTPYGDASLIIKMRHIINTRIIPVTYNANTVTVETVIRNHIRGLILMVINRTIILLLQSTEIRSLKPLRFNAPSHTKTSYSYKQLLLE